MKQILFIDDDPVVIAIYRERLERAGFRVNVAEDGLAAMEELKTLRPDLAVLDLMLPKANGVEVLRYLRGDAALRALPVIVFSNAYLSGLVAQAREAGANKVLLKAESSPATLLRAIHEFLPAHEPQPAPTASGASDAALPPSSEEVERELMHKAREGFLRQAAEEVPALRDLCLNYAKNAATRAGRVQLSRLYEKVHFISMRAGLARCHRVDMLSSAFEALLFEMMANPAHPKPAVLQTLAQVTDCLGRLLQLAAEDSAESGLQARVLVVDDDAVCLHCIVATLRHLGLEVDQLTDPKQALQLLCANRRSEPKVSVTRAWGRAGSLRQKSVLPEAAPL